MKKKQTKKTKKIKEVVLDASNIESALEGAKRDSGMYPVSVEMKILGKVYSAQGQTVKDAIQNLKVIGIPKTMSVLKVVKPDGEKSRVLVPRQTFRLFSPSLLMREIAIKQISMLF